MWDNPNIVYGIDSVGDAGVYSIDNERSLIQTVDVLTPIADDPYTFGEIAAANSLSDVYAMGGVPLTALNVIGFPTKLSTDILTRILEGGASKMKEADAVIIGGHTIKDEEIKYGLSVTGIIETNRLVTASGARPGDALVLTKKVGTGVISTALKRGKASEDAILAINESMRMLNRRASELMMKTEVDACTDVTGFGLLGHALTMANQSNVGLRIVAGKVPFFEWALDYAEKGYVPAGTGANFDFVSSKVDFASSVSETERILLSDAQTSGGLLIAVDESKADSFLQVLQSARETAASVIIGEVVSDYLPRISVTS